MNCDNNIALNQGHFLENQIVRMATKIRNSETSSWYERLGSLKDLDKNDE